MNWLKQKGISKKAKSSKQNAFERFIKKPKHVVEKMTACLAMDCEFVGVTERDINFLARVSIVNYDGQVVYDQYVRPHLKVKNFRSKISGIYKNHLKKGIDFTICRAKVAEIIDGRILIGHSIDSDLSVLNLKHPRELTRDTSTKESTLCPNNKRSLKKLVYEHFNSNIQTKSHCPIEDARATLQLYKLVEKKWGQIS
ncbi:hypothetical protein MHBO_002518 [Bonamia ostreae]|uniref:RNA exonuclease 4 n=1 Tax=Bonamia ostreae TaxID=126728 RepID=A0ABV2AN18_9EUKA